MKNWFKEYFLNELTVLKCLSLFKLSTIFNVFFNFFNIILLAIVIYIFGCSNIKLDGNKLSSFYTSSEVTVIALMIAVVGITASFSENSFLKTLKSSGVIKRFYTDVQNIIELSFITLSFIIIYNFYSKEFLLAIITFLFISKIYFLFKTTLFLFGVLKNNIDFKEEDILYRIKNDTDKIVTYLKDKNSK